MTGAAFCISGSRNIQARNGLHTSYAKPFLGTRRRAFFCAIATSIFGQEFVQQLKAIGIKQVLSTPKALRQRAYIERLIGTIRRECLDHVIVFNESSLRRHLVAFTEYYHRSRTHLSLEKDSRTDDGSNRRMPVRLWRSPRSTGSIIATNVAPLKAVRGTAFCTVRLVVVALAFGHIPKLLIREVTGVLMTDRSPCWLALSS